MVQKTILVTHSNHIMGLILMVLCSIAPVLSLVFLISSDLIFG